MCWLSCSPTHQKGINWGKGLGILSLPVEAKQDSWNILKYMIHLSVYVNKRLKNRQLSAAVIQATHGLVSGLKIGICLLCGYGMLCVKSWSPQSSSCPLIFKYLEKWQCFFSFPKHINEDLRAMASEMLLMRYLGVSFFLCYCFLSLSHCFFCLHNKVAFMLFIFIEGLTLNQRCTVLPNSQGFFGF